ncbi:hypothetical protein [Ectothiorhodospira marina]|jgi:hypothetical protein|uniref:Uncharacterized protein n=1 Tax=Ectothiorhodospira marina TaxID=1396821 RepID=A0A1H7QKB5_9GAMM|nr:hypothetical protein [Ectothiorhodospira marina]SEL48044.1 hypothetical protein SAMN05444515_1183 [Ectothiorhodospira marina]
MESFRQRLAEHGFVANEDYAYPVQCLLSARVDHLRCLNIEGSQGRRRTAFGYALGHTLGYEHILYHEYLPPPSPEPVRIIPDWNEEPTGEPPIDPVDRVLGEACALSEGEPAVLILDRLHQAPFAEHLRLAEFIRHGLWHYGDVTLKAHRRNLLVFLISDEPLYHTLQQMSFRIWVDPELDEAPEITPEALGLPSEAGPMLEALREIFADLGTAPTPLEYQRLIHDIHVNVNTLEELRLSLFGWVEDVDRKHLMSALMRRTLERHMPVIQAYVSGTSTPSPTWPPNDGEGSTP